MRIWILVAFVLSTAVALVYSQSPSAFPSAVSLRKFLRDNPSGRGIIL